MKATIVEVKGKTPLYREFVSPAAKDDNLNLQ